jgi:hypothetical protein
MIDKKVTNQQPIGGGVFMQKGILFFSMIFSLLSLFVITTNNIAFAADGSSGCGPGWYILKENSILSSSLRATTNGILWPTTTFGMTTGTAGCTKHKLVLTEKESLYFVTQNFYEIQKEMAQGGGEFLTAFANTLGCKQNSINQIYFNKKMQEKYRSIYPSGTINGEQVERNSSGTLKEIYNIILEDSKLTQSCSFASA